MADFVGPLVDPAPENEFLGPEPAKRTGGFDDPIDEILPAAAENIPLDTGKIGPLACDGCHEPIHPGYREVYDQSRSRLALMAAGALLVLGLLGTAGVGYLDFSLARILLLYFTGVSILAGGALLGVGSFMFFARERVYVCSNCERAYPRG
jgi:hypothetical protein